MSVHAGPLINAATCRFRADEYRRSRRAGARPAAMEQDGVVQRLTRLFMISEAGHSTPIRCLSALHESVRDAGHRDGGSPESIWRHEMQIGGQARCYPATRLQRMAPRRSTCAACEKTVTVTVTRGSRHRLSRRVVDPVGNAPTAFSSIPQRCWAQLDGMPSASGAFTRPVAVHAKMGVKHWPLEFRNNICIACANQHAQTIPHLRIRYSRSILQTPPWPRLPMNGDADSAVTCFPIYRDTGSHARLAKYASHSCHVHRCCMLPANLNPRTQIAYHD